MSQKKDEHSEVLIHRTQVIRFRRDQQTPWDILSVFIVQRASPLRFRWDSLGFRYSWHRTSTLLNIR